MRRPIKGLGEIALRCTDLNQMAKFYEEVIGLELLRRFENSAFFRIAEGYAGHTQILALFDRANTEDYVGLDPARTTVDHIAFAIHLDDFESECQRLRDAGCDVLTTVHPWVKWRSLYVRDPEGNSVELVCYDESIPE